MIQHIIAAGIGALLVKGKKPKKMGHGGKTKATIVDWTKAFQWGTGRPEKTRRPTRWKRGNGAFNGRRKYASVGTMDKGRRKMAHGLAWATTLTWVENLWCIRRIGGINCGFRCWYNKWWLLKLKRRNVELDFSPGVSTQKKKDIMADAKGGHYARMQRRLDARGTECVGKDQEGQRREGYKHDPDCAPVWSDHFGAKSFCRRLPRAVSAWHMAVWQDVSVRWNATNYPW